MAGDAATGRRWRTAYLERMYSTGEYRPYEPLVHAATADADLPDRLATALLDRWDELEPWPGVPEALRELAAAGHRLGVVTNCSEDLGHRAAARLGVPLDVVVTAERAGAYKPDRRPYALASDELGGERTVFLAGSPGDVLGASALGMPVVWHNQAGLPAKPGPQAVAELRTADGLAAAVTAALATA